MVVALRLEVPPETSLRSLVKGFVLTKQTEGKSPRTVEYYRENLRRFIWYADKQGWSDDIRLLNEWRIREFLGYIESGVPRWGLQGNGSETSRKTASHSTLHHYFVTISCFLNWVVTEGFLKENPVARVRVAKPKAKVITPYTTNEITKMLAVCDNDYEHNARFLGSRNKAMILVLFDTGVRLSELIAMKEDDIDKQNGHMKVIGKGNKERVVRMGKVTQKAIWRYLMHRPQIRQRSLWLTEEGRPISAGGVQSMVERLLERAKINGSGSVHKFRHTFSLNFLRIDRNVFNLQYLLGHSDLDMVRRYTSALGMEDALKAHEKASPADMMGLR